MSIIREDLGFNSSPPARDQPQPAQKHSWTLTAESEWRFTVAMFALRRVSI